MVISFQMTSVNRPTREYNHALQPKLNTHSPTIYSRYVTCNASEVDASLQANMVEPRSTEYCLNQIFSFAVKPLQCDNSLHLQIKEKNCHHSILSSHPGTSFLQNLKQTNKNSINENQLTVIPKAWRSKSNIMTIFNNW